MVPKFKGKVYRRDGSEAYKVHAYQYAATSEPTGTMAPDLIVYVADDDTILAIEYARANDLGVAIRSGGHQYIGASSTSGKNIQIDLSGRESEDPNINPICLAQGIFFPHRECCGVHVGGDTQTGGWSVIVLPHRLAPNP